MQVLTMSGKPVNYDTDEAAIATITDGNGELHKAILNNMYLCLRALHPADPPIEIALMTLSRAVDAMNGKANND